MSNWTDKDKDAIVAAYLAAEPTPENSMEIVKEITENGGYPSANGVRMILSQKGVYVKKEAGAKASTSTAKASGDKAPRVSKEDAHKRLVAAIEQAGALADSEIVSKLTGKAAIHFAEIIEKINAA